MTGTPRSTLDPRTDRYRRNREAMGELLDGLVRDQEAAVAASRAARERIDAVLDRDSPFLELAAPLGRVLGLGLVAGIGCAVEADDTVFDERSAGTGDDVASVARRNGLPFVRLDGRGNAELVLPGDTDRGRAFGATVSGLSALRAALARLAGPAPAPPPDAPPPRLDPRELLALAPLDGASLDVREVTWRLVDGSELAELPAGPRSDEVRGWATVCGFPVGIDAGTGDDGFRTDCEQRGLAVLRITGPMPVFEVRRSGGRGLTFAWPQPDGMTAAIDAVDAVVDPLDTRVALGIALAVTRER